MYRPLRQSPESPSLTSKEHDRQDLDDSPEVQRSDRLPYVSLFFCLLLTSANIGFTVISQRASRSASSPVEVTYKNVHLLRRPSQYMRFDEITRPSPVVPRQFNNYPIGVAQVDAAHKRTVFDPEEGSIMTNLGTIVPERRRVLVTPTISTIVEFRSIDWGMEDCELHLSLPSGDASSTVVLYQLNQTHTTDLATLSYETRPPRQAELGTFQPSVEGTAWQHRFACPTDTILTFELACSSTSESKCMLEWWQTRDTKEPEPIIYLTQHATA